jgi:hypothetical protein
MNRVKAILAALAILASLGMGCASLSPSQERIPPPYPDQPTGVYGQQGSSGWDELLWTAFYITGEVLSCR